MRATRRWNASLTALVVLLVSFVAIVPQPADAAVQSNDQSGQYTVWEFAMTGGTYTGNTKTDQTKKTEGFINGNKIHVSCSQQFGSGWANDGTSFPQPSDGAQYEILSYQIQRFAEDGRLIHTCGESFVPDTVSISVTPGTCTWSGEESLTGYTVDIAPAAGATVTVTGPALYLATYTSSGGASVPPGDYAWSVDVAEGYTYDGATSGTFTAGPCEPYQQEVTVSVAPGYCYLDSQQLSKTRFEVTISPSEGAVVDVTGPNGYSATFPADGTSDIVPPGTYNWTVTLADGYSTSSPMQGSFDAESCEPEDVPVSISVIPGACYWNGEESRATYNVNIDPDGGAAVTVTGPNGYSAVFQVSGSDTVDPGTYNWTATVPPGYSTSDPVSGSFTVYPCETEPEPVNVSVIPGVCEWDGEQSLGSYTVNISPDGGATVTVTGPNSYSASYSVDGSDTIETGTYDWTVVPSDGYTTTDPVAGSFTIYPCEPQPEPVTVEVVPGTCSYVDGVSLTDYDVTIDPDGAATVRVSGPDGYAVSYGSDGTDTVTPGTYTWMARALPGYSLVGAASGSFEAITCAEEPDTATVTVTPGSCVWDGEIALTDYEVAISPAGGATVGVSGPDGYSANFSNAGGSDSVAPGEYGWVAAPVGDYLLEGTTSGTFIAEDCVPLPAALGDKVWHDMNGDGIQGVFEPAISEVVVNLISDGTVIDTTVTDIDGIYGFTDLPAGDYTVEFVAPDGWIVTATDQGTDDALDSDGLTVSTNLTEGETDLTLDLGLLLPATIIVEKIVDPVTDDVFEFTGDITAVLGDGETASAEVLPGEYSVTETLAENWLLEDITCTDGGIGDAATGESIYSVRSGDVVTCTYTNTNVGTLTLEKVTDIDTDDTFEFLIGDETHALTTGESVTLELPSGVYVITEDLLVVDGWDLLEVICSPGAEIDLENSEATLYVPPGINVGCTFVNSQAEEVLGVLGDYVWFDVDVDGIQDPDEVGVEGATVELFAPGGAAPLATTTTNAAGIYVFANVPGGDYQVRFTTPAGWLFTDGDQGDSDSIDSDVVKIGAELTGLVASTVNSAVPSSGFTDVFTLEPGAVDVTIDAGIFQLQVQNVTITQTPKTPPSVGTATPDVAPPSVAATTPDVASPSVGDTKVLAAQTELPNTGFSNGGLSAAALVLLGGGAILLAATRRKEEELAVATGFGKRLSR